ncbi:CBY1-interacting BAR domain-containing protein 1 [Periplaneta americana]|uniref:CBY1-interacting BAR domain-containing protein 1 n=1 Tax=Periplaneta americana TaxID=6978 RepID=UPI0037E9244F
MHIQGTNNMIKANRPQHIACEQQAKFIQERITLVEKHFAELCTIFAAYTRKNAGLRDKSDEVVKVIQDYAEAENVNKSLRNGLLQFSSTLSTIGDYRDTEVQRLETKVVTELSQYEDICKHAKEEVKNTFVARDRELARKKHLDRIKERNPRNRQQISLAESELLKASADVSRTVKALEEQIDMFEKKKLHDIKSLLLAFVTIELGFHTKAVELFTKAYQEVADIDEDEDLEDFQQIRGSLDGVKKDLLQSLCTYVNEFKNALRVPDSVSRLDTVKRTSFRNSSFSLANLFSTPTSFRKPSEGTHHSPFRTAASDVVESIKTGLEDSIESVHVEEYVEDESSSFVSEEDDRKHVRNKFK